MPFQLECSTGYLKLRSSRTCSSSSTPPIAHWTAKARKMQLFRSSKLGTQVPEGRRKRTKTHCSIVPISKSVKTSICRRSLGGLVSLTQNTTQKLADSIKNVKLSRPPGNFRDAVSIPRDLGIQHLWIDSLCVIQEGDNKQDLGREIAKIGFVHQNARQIVAAVSSPDFNAGCFINSCWPYVCTRTHDSNGPTYITGARRLDRKLRNLCTVFCTKTFLQPPGRLCFSII